MTRSGESGFYLGADGTHVGPALSAALDEAHHLAHVPDGLGTTFGDGLSDKRIMSVDHSLCVKNFDALGGVADIDPTAAMTFA
jgi:hypothetical protein